MFAAVATSLAALGHVNAGGHAPDPAILIVAAALVAASVSGFGRTPTQWAADHRNAGRQPSLLPPAVRGDGPSVGFRRRRPDGLVPPVRRRRVGMDDDGRRECAVPALRGAAPADRPPQP